QGVGGQVVAPMLYDYDFEGYIWRLGGGIRRAVEDGASIVSISAGFPCRVQTNLGLDLGICSAAELLASCLFVSSIINIVPVVACAATAEVPIVGAVACAIAATAVAITTGICVGTTFYAGNLGAPLRAGVRDATAAGVPVVSIAGNDPTNAIPPLIRPFVDVSDLRAETWEMVPCTIDDVICVGRAQPVTPYRNLEFFGNAVDIWAPDFGQYFGPSDIDDPSSPQVNLGMGTGTSAATAYTSGTIALLMAAEPDLDPRRTRRTGADLALIPQAIVSRLRESATGALDEAPNRGPLIYPFALVTRPLRRHLGALDLLGYSLDYDLSEANPDPNDVESTAPFLPEDGAPVAGTVHFIRGTNGAPDSRDEDWLVTGTLAESGLYDVRVEVRSPWNVRGELEPPSLIGSGFQLESEATTPAGNERVQVFARRGALHGAVLPFRLEGDNHYIVRLLEVVRTGDAPPSDRFDFVNALNPPESTPNNNVPERAVLLGGRSDGFSELNWTLEEESNLKTLSSIEIPSLSLTQSQGGAVFPVFVPDVADEFAVASFPEHRIYTGEICLTRTLSVESRPEINITFHTACNGNTARQDLPEIRAGVVDLSARGTPLGPDGCVAIEITPRGPPGTTVLDYTLRVTYETPGQVCELFP
ncbi:MAG: S8/S53 family peptidase, partial [Sandaracinaceae bacterium]|nr:S8/S53 family peptidase [Sandaracinaceae bacterium]